MTSEPVPATADGPFGPAVVVPGDVRAARWLPPALGPFGTVGGLVPRGHDGYLLLDLRRDDPLGWDGECRLFGELVPLLAQHTTTPDRCWFAIWEGHGFDTATTVLAAEPADDDARRALDRERRRLDEEDVLRNRSIRAALEALPSFELPHRRYFLLHGAIDSASRIRSPGVATPHPPDLWWPEDRRWFVGGDTDLEWRYIGGPAPLIAAVQASFPGSTRPVEWAQANIDV